MIFKEFSKIVRYHLSMIFVGVKEAKDSYLKCLYLWTNRTNNEDQLYFFFGKPWSYDSAN